MDDLEIGDALALAAEAWGKAPFTPYYLDYEQPDTWPDPWTLIAENYYCDLARALGLLYTVYLSRHGSEHDLKLRILRRPNDRSQYNLVIVDQGKYVLNFLDHEVVNIESTAKETLLTLVEYSSDDLGLQRY
jgi:hypothetical protein